MPAEQSATPAHARPEGTATWGYRPQIDGVRAVAIGLVVAFHLGYLNGGWIGVDVFFVLSGYLITSILIAEHGRPRELRKFWGRRARRLLPAALLMVAVVVVYAWAGGPGVVGPQLKGPALATVLYAANWQEIIAGHGYFAAYNAPDPLQHTWSLAIEEQFYLLWPMLLGLILWSTRSRSRAARAGMVGGLALASVVWMGVAAHVYGTNRAYLGTDTRAWELLLGASAALLLPMDRPIGSGHRWGVLTTLGVAGVVAGVAVAGGPPEWIWDGGLAAIAVGAALVIVGSVQHPRGWVARALSIPSLAWLGSISYSVYLWHWPVIVLMSPDNIGLSGGQLLLVRLATIMAASTGSYYLVERPLRRADWSTLARRIHAPVPIFGVAAVAAAAALVIAATGVPTRARSALVGSSGASGFPSTVAESPVAPHLDLPAPSSAHPYRIWIIGDSVINDASPGLTAALDATGQADVVANTSFPGWGLTTDAHFPSDVRSQVARSKPQIVMGTWSWDDEPAYDDPAAYTQRLESVIATLLRPPFDLQVVMFLQFPQTGPDIEVPDPSTRERDWATQTEQQDAWNRDAAAAASAFPGHALFLQTDQLFAPAGRFFTWYPAPGGRWIRARKLDNAHFCPYGAAEFGALLANDFSKMLGVGPPAAGWELGSWTRAPRYNDPPGACPADQPPPGYRGVAVPGG